MIISNRNLILALIPFMAYFSMKPQTCSFPFMAFLTNCMLAGNNHHTKVFLLYSLSLVMGSALVDASGKAATSLRKMSTSFEAGSSCVLSQTHLHGEDLRAQFATLSPISNRGARILLMQQLFQKQKMKGIVKFFVSAERGNASELYLSTAKLLPCPWLSSLFFKLLF